jgi:phage tail protein X
MSVGAAAVEAAAAVDPTRAVRYQRLAALLAVAAVGEALGILVIGSRGDPRFRFQVNLITVGFLATVVLFPIMGALIVQRRPYTRVAWLMVLLGLGVGFGLVSYAYGVVALPPADPLPFAMPLLVLSQLFFVPSIGGATTWILLLYPTDHLLSPRWRWVGVTAVVGVIAYVVGTLFRPSEIDPIALPGLRNPVGVPGDLGAAFGLLADASNLLGLGCLFVAAASLIIRYRRADPVVAAQIRWLALAAVLAILTLALSLAPVGDLDDVFFGLGLSFAACMPIAIGIAITRYRLYDIDRLINRALVYGSLTAILAGVFTAAIGLAQRLFIAVTHETSDGAVVAATLVVATLYAPLRKRLEAIVDRWFKYESRQFGAYRAQVKAFLDMAVPGHAVERLAREAYDELDPVGLAVIDRDERIAATAGIWPQSIVVRLPIGRGDDFVGTLLVGPRRDGRPHDAREVEDLAELALLVGTAATRG